MTDLEKWKKLLDEMNIKYEEEEHIISIFNDDYTAYTNKPVIYLNINSHLGDNYNPGLYIVFSKDGSFMYFNPLGE